MAKKQGKPMSLRDFAKLRGCSAPSVTKAIQSGRLDESVVIVDGEPKIADPDLANEEWDANTRDPDPEPEADAPDADIRLNEARRRKEIETWRKIKAERETTELELAHRRGELVSVEEARAEVIERFTVVKTKLLGLATRVKQRAPEISDGHIRMIDDLVREALEDLAEERNDG